MDQPHNDLLGCLETIMSHDNKEIRLKITDKTQKDGLRTKDMILRAYPSRLGLRIDSLRHTYAAGDKR